MCFDFLLMSLLAIQAMATLLPSECMSKRVCISKPNVDDVEVVHAVLGSKLVPKVVGVQRVEGTDDVVVTGQNVVLQERGKRSPKNPGKKREARVEIGSID